MSFTKFASFEVSEVLDVKGTAQRQKTASLDKLSEYGDFRTNDGYMYARIRAISSRVNKNHDGWPSVELAGSAEVFDQHTSSEGFTIEASKDKKYGFSTFVGKPIFVDHNNTDPKRARGVIVDAKFHVEDHHTASLDPYYSSKDVDPEHLPASWVELLLEIDADRFPVLAKAIKEGSEDGSKGIDGFSMGCDVEKTICSICSNTATAPDEFCEHIRLKGATFDFKDSSTGEKVAKKSYENCYGIKFFEISAVFDPADETALLRELIHKEGAANYVPPSAHHETDFATMVRYLIERGYDEDMAVEMATNYLEVPNPQVVHGEGAVPDHVKIKDTMPMPPEMDAHTPRRQGSYLQAKLGSRVKEADNPAPQSELTKAPEDVDTLREEKICPVCGSDMDSDKCEVCGHTEPPDGLNNPDLTKADEFDLAEEATNPDEGQSYLDARRNGEPDRLSSRMWEPKIDPRLAGRINVTERPLKPEQTPATDEPQETVIKDEPKPVTSSTRTAADLVAAAGQTQQENSMSDTRTAAEPADPSAKPDKRVDVEGVGGVQDASNESASKADKQVDVEGKGGVMDASNAEAASPDRTESVEKEGEKQTSGPTKTWEKGKGHLDTNTVDQRAMQAATDHEAAKSGTKPIGGADVQPQRREDLEQESGFSNPQKGTDQWTGTDGNGVTRQQNPVTRVVDPNIDSRRSQVTSHIVNVFKLADTEVELGMIDASAKYARIAELEPEDEAVIAARLDTLSRVRTAGLTKKASLTRLPSLKQASTSESPQEKVAATEDPRYEDALFGL